MTAVEAKKQAVENNRRELHGIINSISTCSKYGLFKHNIPGNISKYTRAELESKGYRIVEGECENKLNKLSKIHSINIKTTTVSWE